MKRFLVLLAITVLSVTVHAGTIVVSGDSNLGNGIDGSAGSPLADNGFFFKNMLGGGTKVALETTTNPNLNTLIESQTAIVNYYNGLPGVTVNVIAAPVTAAALTGARVFIAFLPDIAFSAGETSAISTFLNSGGTALFMGEFSDFDLVADANINAILSALGSPLAIVPAALDEGFHVASGAQIAPDPLTAGVAHFTYAATSAVSGGKPLFFTTNGTPFIEYVTIPEPSTLLLVAGAGLWFLALQRLLHWFARLDHLRKY